MVKKEKVSCGKGGEKESACGREIEAGTEIEGMNERKCNRGREKERCMLRKSERERK